MNEPTRRHASCIEALEPRRLLAGNAFADNALIGRGINWDNSFIGGRDAPYGDTAYYAEVSRMADAGFDSVRLQTRWDNSGNGAGGSAFDIDPTFLADVRQKVTWVLEHGMTAVVDVHYFEQLNANNWVNPAYPEEGTFDEKFVEIWRELAWGSRTCPPAASSSTSSTSRTAPRATVTATAGSRSTMTTPTATATS